MSIFDVVPKLVVNRGLRKQAKDNSLTSNQHPANSPKVNWTNVNSSKANSSNRPTPLIRQLAVGSFAERETRQKGQPVKEQFVKLAGREFQGKAFLLLTCLAFNCRTQIYFLHFFADDLPQNTSTMESETPKTYSRNAQITRLCPFYYHQKLLILKVLFFLFFFWEAYEH